MTAPARPAVVVYDADCGLCRASALWLLRRAQRAGAHPDALELLPCRSPERLRRFPALSEAECLRAMQLILPDGSVLAGADAVPEILARVPRWRWLGTLLALPTLRPLARRVYAWIAARRLELSCRRPAPP